MEVHGFLKEHRAFLPYTAKDLEHDCEVARRVAQYAQTRGGEEAASERRAG